MAISISKWLRVNRIALDLDYAIELVKDYTDCVTEVVFWDNGEDYVIYEGLDELCIREHLWCAIGDDSDAVIVGRNHYLYLMECYDPFGNFINVVKIGVSKWPEKRAEQLTEAWKRKRLTFRVKKIDKGSWYKRRVYNAEAAIHTILRRKGLQYRTGVKYDGYSELFIWEPWIMNLI